MPTLKTISPEIQPCRYTSRLIQRNPAPTSRKDYCKPIALCHPLHRCHVVADPVTIPASPNPLSHIHQQRSLPAIVDPSGIARCREVRNLLFYRRQTALVVTRHSPRWTRLKNAVTPKSERNRPNAVEALPPIYCVVCLLWSSDLRTLFG